MLRKLALLLVLLLVAVPAVAAERTLCWDQNPHKGILGQMNQGLLEEGSPEWVAAKDSLLLAAKEDDDWARITLANLASRSWQGQLDSYRAAREIVARGKNAKPIELLEGALASYTRSEAVGFLARIPKKGPYAALAAHQLVALFNGQWSSPEVRAALVKIAGDPIARMEQYRAACPADAWGLLQLRGSATAETPKVNWTALAVSRETFEACMASKDELNCVVTAQSIVGKKYPFEQLTEAGDRLFADNFQRRHAFAATTAELRGDQQEMVRLQDTILQEAERSDSWCVAGGHRHRPFGILLLRWEAANGAGSFNRASLTPAAIREYLDITRRREQCKYEVSSVKWRYPSVALRALMEGILSYPQFTEVCDRYAAEEPFLSSVCMEGAALNGDLAGFDRHAVALKLEEAKNALAAPAVEGYRRDDSPDEPGEEERGKVIARLNRETLRCLAARGCTEKDVRKMVEAALPLFGHHLDNWTGTLLAPVFEMAARITKGPDGAAMRRTTAALNVASFRTVFSTAGWNLEPEPGLPLDTSHEAWLEQGGSESGWSLWETTANKLETFRFKPLPTTGITDFRVSLSLPRFENLTEVANLIPEKGIVFVSEGAEWCPPCRSEMKFLMNELRPALAEKGIGMAIISLDMAPERFVTLLEDLGLKVEPGTFFYDRDQEKFGPLVEKLGIGGGVPKNLVIVDGQLKGWTYAFPPGQSAQKVRDAILALAAPKK